MAFETLGGKAEDYHKAKQDGAADRATTVLKTCVDATLDQAGTADTSPSVLKAAREGCDDRVRAAFESSGGDVMDIQVAKLDGATRVGTEKIRSCLANVDGYASKSPADKKAVKSTCYDEAELEFRKVGGAELKSFKKAARDGASDKAADKMTACVDEYIAGLSLESNGETASRGLYAGGTKTCLDATKKEYEDSGGDEANYATDVVDASAKKLADKLKACVGKQLRLDVSSDAKAVKEKKAFVACQPEPGVTKTSKHVGL